MKKMNVKTVIKDENGRFWILEKYVRKTEKIGENGKEVQGGIDWEETKKVMTEIKDEETIKQFEKMEKEGVVKITNGDPEFFAAGTGELAS